MKDCVFYNIVKIGDNNEKEKNVILYGDDLLLITQATGSLVRGYLMIVIKRHINGLAELLKEELKHLEKLINTIEEDKRELFPVSTYLKDYKLL